MSDLIKIGAHCAVTTCNVLDFLPLTCKCQLVLCRDHIFPDNHDCSFKQEAVATTATTSNTPLQRCGLEECQKPTLYAYTIEPQRETCERCHGSFCAEHRYQDTHNCTPPVDSAEAAKPESSARALLKKNFGTKIAAAGGSTRPKAAKKPPTDPVKLAQWKKVELMKLRHRAVPADVKDKGQSPPVDQRLTLNVVFNEVEKPFWFKQTVSVGRAIDMLSGHLKASSSNTLTTTLHSVDVSTGDEVALRNESELAKQVEDGSTIKLIQVPSTL